MEHRIRLLDQEPDKELTNSPEFIGGASICLNCVKSARQLEECHLIID